MINNDSINMSQQERYEQIGRSVIAKQEARRQTNAQMFPIWHAEGQSFKLVRENANISQAEISKAIGADESVIRRFENGLFVKRRPVIKATYGLALETISLRRLNVIHSLVTNKHDVLSNAE